MGEEREFVDRRTAWVRGPATTKMGHAILTPDRFLFFDQKFAPGAAGGVLGGLIGDRLQKRHEEGGPLLDLPLETITRVARQKKLLNKDRISLSTGDGDYLFNDGWSDFSPVLRERLTAGLGRKVVETEPDAWSVEPGP